MTIQAGTPKWRSIQVRVLIGISTNLEGLGVLWVRRRGWQHSTVVGFDRSLGYTLKEKD